MRTKAPKPYNPAAPRDAKPTKAKRPRGNQTSFTQERANAICAELVKGHTLRAVCRDNPSFPTESAIREWAREDYHGFGTQYVRAREIGYHAMADELVAIADRATNNGNTQARRLQVDARKWLLSKALPKVYGDKLDVAHDGGIKIVSLSDVEKDI